jgi:hypothetical protein
LSVSATLAVAAVFAAAVLGGCGPSGGTDHLAGVQAFISRFNATATVPIEDVSLVMGGHEGLGGTVGSINVNVLAPGRDEIPSGLPARVQVSGANQDNVPDGTAKGRTIFAELAKTLDPSLTEEQLQPAWDSVVARTATESDPYLLGNGILVTSDPDDNWVANSWEFRALEG